MLDKRGSEPQMQRNISVQLGTVPIPNPSINPEGVQRGTVPSTVAPDTTRLNPIRRYTQGVQLGTGPNVSPGGVHPGTVPPGLRQNTECNQAYDIISNSSNDRDQT
eukprot:12318267-Karenia_brevis.AAC.1